MVLPNIKSLLGHSSFTTAFVGVDTDGIVAIVNEDGSAFALGAGITGRLANQLRDEHGNTDEIRFLRGFTTEGDGGGGDFYWSDIPAIDDGGTVLNELGVGSNSAGWRRIESGPRNIAWFGADSTGVSDSSLALQRAIDSFDTSKGGELFVPPGTYLISSTINFKTGITMRGSGAYYTGPGGGGQNVTVFKWTGGTGANTCFQLLANAVRGDIRQVTLSDFVLTGNFAGTASSVVGLRISGSPGGWAVSNCRFENLYINEFDECVHWGDGAVNNSQADSITFSHCSFKYYTSYGIYINSNNAADESMLYNCFFNNTLLVGSIAAIFIEYAGNLIIRQTSAGNQDTFIKTNAASGNQLSVEYGTTETVNWFLDSYGPSDGRTITMIGNNINNPIRIASVDRVMAIGNLFHGLTAAGLPKGLVLGAGARWQGFANRYLQPYFRLDTSGGGTFHEDTLPDAGGHYNEQYHGQGEILRWPGQMFGVSPDGRGDVNFAAGELCLRSGFRGAPWAANTAYTATQRVVARLDNGHAFECTTPGTSDGSEPTWNTGSGATTNDGTVVWTEIGDSSHHALFGPPDHYRNNGIPSHYCRKGTVVWNQDNYDTARVLGWVAIADTIGANAVDWRSFGFINGSNDGLTHAHGNAPIIGSELEENPLLHGFTGVTLSGATYTLDEDEYIYPAISFTGAPGADCTITFPDITSLGGNRVAYFWISNGTTGGFKLILDAGGTTVEVKTNERVQVALVGNNLVPLGPRMVDVTYSFTNLSTDRGYDANATTVDELADVLGTLVGDLRTAGVLK